MKFSKQHAADASLILITFFWASAYFVIKDIQHTGNAITLLFYRLGVAALITGLVLYYKKIPLFQNFKYGFLLGAILWVADVPQSIGLNYTKASNTAFIIGLFVVFLPFFNYFFNKKLLGIKNFFAILISIIGLWILTGGVRGANFGDWLNLITALATAAHVFFTDRFVRKDFNPYALAFQLFLTVTVLNFATMLILGLPFSIGNPGNIWGIFYLAIFANFIPYIVQNVAQKYTTTIRVGLIFLMEPVFTAVLAWTVWHEQFSAVRALGGLLILAAMLISELSLKKYFFTNKGSPPQAARY